MLYYYRVARTVNPAAHARRRAAIVDAAAIEFARNGIDATTTAAICRRAGIGSGTLFHYFATKPAIVYAVFADDAPRVAELRDRVLAMSDPEDGLAAAIDYVLHELNDSTAAGLASAAAVQAGRDPQFADLLQSLDAAKRDILATLLHRLRDTGRELPLSPESCANWILTVVDATHLGLASEPNTDPRPELRIIIDWLCGESTTEGPPARRSRTR